MYIIVPYIAFGIILFTNHILGNNIYDLLFFGWFIAIQIMAFFYAKDNPTTTLKIFSILGCFAMIIGLLSTGKVALFSIISGGLFVQLCGRAYLLLVFMTLKNTLHKVHLF